MEALASLKFPDLKPIQEPASCRVSVPAAGQNINPNPQNGCVFKNGEPRFQGKPKAKPDICWPTEFDTCPQVRCKGQGPHLELNLGPGKMDVAAQKLPAGGVKTVPHKYTQIPEIRSEAQFAAMILCCQVR